MHGMAKILASINHAFGIPRRDVPPTPSNDLVQWSQWNLVHSSAADRAVADEPSQCAVADIHNAIVVDHATLAAIDSFIDALPRSARSQLAAHALPYLVSSYHFAASVLLLLAAIALVVFLLSVLGSVGFGAATWLGAMVGCGANFVLTRTWRRHVIREYLRRMPPDWVLTPCPLCHYDQRGIPSPRCPECGCPVRI